MGELRRLRTFPPSPRKGEARRFSVIRRGAHREYVRVDIMAERGLYEDAKKGNASGGFLAGRRKLNQAERVGSHVAESLARKS